MSVTGPLKIAVIAGEESGDLLGAEGRREHEKEEEDGKDGKDGEDGR